MSAGRRSNRSRLSFEKWPPGGRRAVISHLSTRGIDVGTVWATHELVVDEDFVPLVRRLVDEASADALGTLPQSTELSGAEISYSTVEWLAAEFDQVTTNLGNREVPFLIDRGELIVATEHESIADAIIEAATGGTPRHN